MKSLLWSVFILLNSYALPIPLEKAPNYSKKMEAIEPTDDLRRIKSNFFNNKEIAFKKLVAGDDIAESGKGSTIYFVFNSKNEQIALIKQLPLDDKYDKEELTDEVSSLHERYFFGAKYVHVPKLIGTCEFASEDLAARGYIIETVAKGLSINALVKDVSKAKDVKRGRLLVKLKRSVQATAKALAELHSLHKKSSYNSFYDTQFKGIHDKQFKGPYGMIHGDAHIGNIFYDQKTNEVTFIDLSFLPLSINGAPIGIDSGKFLFSLEGIASFYGLSDKEVEELTTCYTTTYLKHNPTISEQAIDEYKTIAYKEFSFESGAVSKDGTDQGSFLHRYAVNKLNKDNLA
jgi:hypothetical protein